MSAGYGTKWSFYSYICHIELFGDRFCSWVELPVQRRLCPIFVINVGLPDVHEYSTG